MLKFIIRRLLYTIPIVLGVLLITYLLFYVVSGDIALLMAGKNADARQLEIIRKKNGFDKPLMFVHWDSEKYAADCKEADPEGWEAYLAEMKMYDAKIAEAKAAGDRVTEKTLDKPSMPGGVLSKMKYVRWSNDNQFFNHVKNTLMFRFGKSYHDKEYVSTKIKQGALPSLMLTVPMFFATLITSISISLFVAYVRGSKWDTSIVIICVAGMSIPMLSFIVFGQYILAYKYNLFPVIYWPGSNPVAGMALPVMIGVIAGLGGNVRFYRTVMLDEIRNDYVRTAFAKGLPAGKVLFKHVLKNAMIPIITNVVMAIPFLFLGSLLLESYFAIPGLGYLMIEAIAQRDVQVIMAMTFISAILLVVFTLITDICYAFVDPRISFE